MANVDILEVNKGMAILLMFQAYFHSFISNILWHIKKMLCLIIREFYLLVIPLSHFLQLIILQNIVSMLE